MFFLRLKNFIGTVMALIVALGVLFFAQSLQIVRFAGLEGRRSFYLKSSSSQAVIKESIFPWEFFDVEGESVLFPCENREETLSQLLQKYNAEILFEEHAGGSVSYYCLTKKWTDGIKIDGMFVNLHVAFNGAYCAVGSPIIFGGF